jgi:glycosyltransferase involved in cell wall biosynthesis|tara:strand:+ start:14321 stop:15271 length:951 start_codon:yes stop_codon:yes gene_type:complete
MNLNTKKQIAVLIPCLNEAVAIGRVVEDFRQVLPESTIYVFDNNSEDLTVDEARKAGAVVFSVERRGKGNVVRAMFRRVDADIYLMVDGDGTYLAKDAAKLIVPIENESVEMVVGDRLSTRVYDQENTRRFHSFGNRLIRWLINQLYKSDCKDILSGYRVFSRYFVENIPVMSEGFEIETEITLHALDKKIDFQEVPINYKERVLGSESKLNTFSDGYRILKTIIAVFKNYRPLSFFAFVASIVSIVGFILGVFPIMEYFKYGHVYKVPLATLAASLEIIAMLLLSNGLILDTIVQQNRERIELRLSENDRRRNRS